MSMGKADNAKLTAEPSEVFCQEESEKSFRAGEGLSPVAGVGLIVSRVGICGKEQTSIFIRGRREPVAVVRVVTTKTKGLADSKEWGGARQPLDGIGFWPEESGLRIEHYRQSTPRCVRATRLGV